MVTIARVGIVYPHICVQSECRVLIYEVRMSLWKLYLKHYIVIHKSVLNNHRRHRRGPAQYVVLKGPSQQHTDKGFT